MSDALDHRLLGFELLGLPAIFALSLLGALGTILILLHVVGRRPRRITVPSLSVWRLSVRVPVRTKGLRPHAFLQLSLRLVFLCLCLAAAAQPWPTPESHEGEYHVLLIECSSAMADHLERARARATRLLDTLPARDRLAVIAFSDTPEVLAGFDARPEVAAAAIASLSVRPGVPDRARALRLADALLKGVPRARRTLLQARDFGPEDNLGITAFGARRRPGHPLTVDVVVGIRNLSNTPSQAGVHVTGPEGPILTETVLLGADEIRTLTAETALSATGAHALVARVTAAPTRDNVPDDSRAELRLPPFQPWQVLHVGARHMFLEGALLSMGDAVAFERVSSSELSARLAQGALALDDWDLVVIEGKSPFSTLPPPGRYLFLGVTGPGLPYRVRGTLNAPIVTEVKAEHPLLAHLSLRDLNIARALHLEPDPGFEVLASSFGRPLLFASRAANPTVSRMSGGSTASAVLAFDVRQSDLPLRPAWPLLIGNVLEHLARSPGARNTPTQPGNDALAVAVRATLNPIFDLRAIDIGPHPPERAPSALDRQPAPTRRTRLDPWRWFALFAFFVLLVLFVWDLLRLSSKRRVWPVLTRLSALALIGFAFFDPRAHPFLTPATRLVLLRDQSGSMRDQQVVADALVAKVYAAAEATRTLEAPRVLTLADAEGTDLEHGLGLAQAALHGARSGHVLVFSDGAETSGQVIRALPWFAKRRVPVTMFRPVSRHASADLEPRLRIETPDDLLVERPFDVVVTFTDAALSNTADLSELELLRDGQRVPASSRTSEKHSSKPHRLFPLVLHDSEPVVLEARMSPTSSPVRHVIRANRPPQILLVADEPTQATRLRALLMRQHFDVTTRAPSAAVTSKLDDFDLIVLMNLPASALPKHWVDQLDTWVERGGGLLLTGGPASFGEGDYQDAPIARLLPVVPRVLGKRERPTLALALVIDRSGSMSGGKIELSKDAARKAALGLHADDLLSVVAFDSRAEAVVQLQPAGNRQRILSQIDRITAGGGTSIVAAVREGYQQLLGAAASRKHLIVLSDGQSSSAGLRSVIQDATAAGMTISAVGVGSGAERSVLQQLAEQGGGRFYFTEDASSIPRIFARDIESVRPLGKETPGGVRARPVARAQLLDGIAWASAPPILGYNAATTRKGAQLLLATSEGTPLFVRWYHGLGQVATWQTDTGARWAVGWPAWRDSSKFWTQAVRALMRSSALRRLPLVATFEGEEAVLTLDTASAGTARPSTGLVGTLLARELLTDAAPLVVPLLEKSPGFYEARVRAPDASAWWFSAHVHADLHTRPGNAAQETAFFAEGGLSRRVAFEHEPLSEAARARLAGALQANGGALRSADVNIEVDPSALFTGPIEPTVPVALAPFLLVLGAIFFVATLAVEHATYRNLKTK